MAWKLGAILCACAASTACAATGGNQAQVDRSEILATARPNVRPFSATLAAFGAMVKGYRAQTEPLVIAIDHLPNQSGVQKGLPTDLAMYAEKAISDAGSPLSHVRIQPPSMGINTSASAFEERPTVPYVLKLRGGLLRYSERVIHRRELGGGAIGTISGRDFDSEARVDDVLTVSVVRVGLNVVRPSGESVSGSNAVYELLIERNEDGASVGFYLDGSGLGVATRVIVAQDVGNALQDVVSACVVHALGNALMLPYHRCDPLLQEDPRLRQRVRQDVALMPESGLDQILKRYLFLGGSLLNMRRPQLSAVEREILCREMRNAGLDPHQRDHRVEFVMQKWDTLDYDQGARRIDDLAVSLATVRAAPPRSSGTQPPGGPVGAAHFGWPREAVVVVLDLSRIPSGTTRDKILEVAFGVPECQEIREDASRKLFGLLFSSPKPVELQQALRRTADLSGLNYVWTDARWTHLVVVPRG